MSFGKKFVAITFSDREYLHSLLVFEKVVFPNVNVLLLDRCDTCNGIFSSHELLEEHEFTCRPTMIDNSAVTMINEA